MSFAPNVKSPVLRPVRAIYTAFAAILLMVSAVWLTGCGAGDFASARPTAGVALTGDVHGGQQPVAGAVIQLYAVGAGGDGTAAAPLIAATVTTDSKGGFGISSTYTCPTAATQVYLTATGGNPGMASGTNNKALTMMTALGACGNLSQVSFISINELTTVASLAPISMYVGGPANIASSSADATQFAQALAEVSEYTNVNAGTVPGPDLPAGYYASSTEIITLADVIASCINSAGGTAGDSTQCGQLFKFATPPNGSAPTDTITAVANIIKNANQNVSAIFNLLQPSSPFQTPLTAAPANWELPIVPIAATPVISPVSGAYMGPQTVTITDSSPKSSIYYTVDGSTPTVSATLYTGSFIASSSETVKALAVATGYVNSAVVTSNLAITVSGVAAKLAFIKQPSDTAYGVVIAPSVQVAVEDALGNIVTTGGNSVTLALASNPGNSTLSGTVTQPAVNGIATFNNLSVNNLGNGYQFAAFGAGFYTISNTFNVTPYPITVTPADPLLGVGSTLPGTLTLSQPAPAGGLSVAISSSDITTLTVTPATIQIAAGASTGSFTYTGVATGTANLVAAATSYLTSSAPVTVTNSYVSMGTLPALTIGSSAQLSLTLGSTAPAGGLTVSFSSSNTSVATVTPSVFVPAGAKIATQIPALTGVGPGTTTITASAPNYAPDVKAVTLNIGLSLPATISVPISTYTTTATLTLNSAAPSGGITVMLTTDKASVATVPASVTVAAGATTATFSITAVSQGTTTLRADYPGSSEATSTINVQGSLGFSGSLYAGAGLTTTGLAAYLISAPSAPATITVTSSNPAVATLGAGSTATAAGTTSITFPNQLSTYSYQYYNVQGISSGTSVITISAPGYASVTYTVTVYPTALIFSTYYGTSVSTGSTTALSVSTAIVNPATSAVLASGFPINPGGATLSIPVTSSNPAVGTITVSPVSISTGQSSASTSFKALTAGTSTISLGAQPTGTTLPAASTQITETVLAPSLYASIPGVVGAGLSSTYNYVSLNNYGSTTGTSITVTSSNPAVLTLQAGYSATAAGTAAITFSNVTASSSNYYVLEGQSVGTSTLTITSPGLAPITYTVTVDPVGIVFSTTSFSTTANTAYYLYLTTAVLNPANMAVLTTGQALNPGAATISIPVVSGTPAVGTVSSSPVTIVAGSAQSSTTFQSLTAGSSVISLSQPAGYTVPATQTTLTATVTAPTLQYSGAVTTGVGLTSSSYSYVYFSAAPATGATITVTSSNPAVATLGVGTTASAAGVASITFSNVTGGYNYQYYNVQGQSAGTATVTISSPGYTSATYTVTVLPSALVFNYQNSFSTTTLSSPTNLTVTTATLSGGSVNGTGYTVNPGSGSVSIAVLSGTPAVGTITSSPVTIPAGSNSATTTFKPLSAGTSTLSLGTQPAGFSTPISSSYTQGIATVTAPNITTSGAVTLGVGLNNGSASGSLYYYGASSAALSVAPPTPSSLTITSSNPAVATISPGQTATVSGSAALTFTNITTTASQYFNVQGLSVGTSTITVSSSGYANSTFLVTVDPSGFVFTTGSFSTTTYSTATPITVSTAVLNPSSLAVISTGLPLNPGFATVSIGVTSGTSSVGTISASPVTFSAGQATATTTFVPVAAGVSTVALGTQPAGFTTAGQATNVYLNATVTAPTINFNGTTSVSTGSNSTYNYAELSVAPPAPVTLTITSSNPLVATLVSGTTASPATIGSSSLTYNNVSGTNYYYYSIQGVTPGSSTITISAPGYTTVTFVVSVQ